MLLFVIDCTGHGVPDAFVTMIVKSIEREITSNLRKHYQTDISPAMIMKYFDRTINKLLKQDSKENYSNVGFDGAIIYYNKQKNIIKFTGAKTSLLYITNDGKLNTIQGDKYSVGYINSKKQSQFSETVIEVKEGMKFFCTTDGYIDQNGGEKGFPFGKKRFNSIIQNNYKKPINQFNDIFINELNKWMKPNHEQSDDITIIGFEI